MIVAYSCTEADSRPHFCLACLDWILPFCNFFRRLGNLVAGFLATRLSLFAIARPPLNQGSSSDFSLYREARARALGTASRTSIGRIEYPAQAVLSRTTVRFLCPLTGCRPTSKVAGVARAGPISRSPPPEAGAGQPG